MRWPLLIGQIDSSDIEPDGDRLVTVLQRFLMSKADRLGSRPGVVSSEIDEQPAGFRISALCICLSAPSRSHLFAGR